MGKSTPTQEGGRHSEIILSFLAVQFFIMTFTTYFHFPESLHVCLSKFCANLIKPIR